jgi:hypothetical protein
MQRFVDDTSRRSTDRARRDVTGSICLSRHRSRAAAVTLAAAAMLIAAQPVPSRAEGRFQLVSRSLMQGPARAAASFGGHIILGTGGGIAIYRTDGGFQRESFLPLEGEPYDIVVKGDRAYIAAFRGGLRIVDISDPTHPVETGRYETRDAKQCVVSGDLLFLGDSRSGVYLLDIRSPDEPKMRDIIEPKVPLSSIAYESDTLAIALAKSVRVYRIGERGMAPVLISEYETPIKIEKCILARGTLYLLTGEGNILRSSLDDPAGAVELEYMPITEVLDFCIDGGLGLALTKNGGVIPFGVRGTAESHASGTRGSITLGKPLKVPPLQETEESNWLERLMKRFSQGGTVRGRRIFLSGDRFAVVGGLDGISVYSLSNGGIRFVGAENPRGFALNVVVRDNTLYLANGKDGVRIGSVGDDGSIEWIGHIQTGEARDVDLDGDVLVLADGKDGLKLFDARDPSHPELLGKHSSPFFHHAIMIYDKMAYIAGGTGGVEVFDITDPRRPRLVWRKALSEVRGVHADGRFFYVADGYDGFKIYSLEHEAPVLVSTLDTPGWNCDCFVIGDTAYLADGGNGIRIADVSDRGKPRDLGSINLKTLVREIYVLPGTAFAAAHITGVAAIDVSDSERPVIADRYETVDDARGVFADERFVYLASGSGGLYIFRYSR